MSRRLLALTLLLAAPSLHAVDVARHDLTVTLDPAAHRVSAVDKVTLQRGLAHGKTLRFVLHRGLSPQVRTANAKLERVETAQEVSALHERYAVTLPPGARELELAYGGEIFHPLSDEASELARGMRESAGIIGPEGVFLEGGSGWYPRFDDDALFGFTLEARVPQDWEAISQGARTRHETAGAQRVVRWEETQPQDEIYLVAALFTEYTQSADGVQAMVFLREQDESLARTYLDATVRYVNMYSALLGAYPYAKFALVENFWETGYGMPSFTLLGSKVLRLPFIVTSSYPHEILHNWWGNGVYVDYARGNWSEGLTSYLADHLLQEQRGQGAEYRRAALQKYSDFVRGARDFPLTEFRSRHSSATEAVGYGKTLMLLHMLRRELGDELFVQALREFYRRYQFKSASFDDLKQVFSAVAQRNLDADFDPWVKRVGAPQLRVSEVHVARAGDAYELRALVEQTQEGAAFPLNLPLAVHIAGAANAVQSTQRMTDKRLELNLKLNGQPLRLDVDPEFDLFRRLDRAEIPPALSQVFGADKTLIVIPGGAAPALRAAYQNVAALWQQAEPSRIEIKTDAEVKALPKNRAVWLFGWENRWRRRVSEALTGYEFAATDAAVRIGSESVARSGHAVVVTARSPAQPDRAIAWLATDDAQALPALARKLPHYAKYSYLAFEGAAANNTLKGQWPVVGSPLSVLIPSADGGASNARPAALAQRAALVVPAAR